MRKIRFETMLPDELLAERDRSGIAYLPVGSMEWHGPHMAMGMDTLNAYAVAQGAAQQTGGVVLPPLYIGTETPRSPQVLQKLGFTGEEHIVGMDFPKNSVKSFYWPKELFEQILRCQAQMLCDMGFCHIVLLNGHGADQQVEILARIARELTCSTQKTVQALFALFDDCGVGVGHAGLVETAIMQYLCPQGVELGRLPSRPQKIYTAQYGIADSETFEKGPTADFSVRYDPRDATPALGEKLVAHAVRRCVEQVMAAHPGS
jgi:creatinine amidohydrolase